MKEYDLDYMKHKVLEPVAEIEERARALSLTIAQDDDIHPDLRAQFGSVAAQWTVFYCNMSANISRLVHHADGDGGHFTGGP